MQKPLLHPHKKLNKKHTEIHGKLALRGKLSHSAVTAQGLMFNAGHADGSRAPSVMAVAGGGLIQTKKNTLRRGWSGQASSRTMKSFNGHFKEEEEEQSVAETNLNVIYGSDICDLVLISLLTLYSSSFGK